MVYDNKPIFGTMIPAMVTPFDKDGDLDLAQAQALAERLVENGAEAKEVIQAGKVLYNTEVCTQRGKKCYPGDLVEYAGEEIRVV